MNIINIKLGDLLISESEPDRVTSQYVMQRSLGSDRRRLDDVSQSDTGLT